jgi:hypothetical protein
MTQDDYYYLVLVALDAYADQVRHEVGETRAPRWVGAAEELLARIDATKVWVRAQREGAIPQEQQS